jgi:hypothetical protein
MIFFVIIMSLIERQLYYEIVKVVGVKPAKAASLL